MSFTATAADELLAAYRAQKGKQPASAPTSSATSSARASKSAPSSTTSPEQQSDPLIALRDQLRAEQTRLTDVQKLIKTFEQLSAGGTSANIADSTLRVAFPRADPGSILKNDPDARPTAFFSAKPSSSGTVYLPPFELDASAEPSSSSKPIRCDSYAAAIAELRTRETKLAQRAESLRKEILGVASEAVQQKLGIQLPALDKAGSTSRKAHEDQLNDKGEVLNEEGLPFFEPMEMLPDEDASRPQSNGKGKARQGETIAPFRPKAQDKASKSAFMDAIFSKLEAEEEEYLANGGDEEEEDAAASRREEDDDADEDMADSQESGHDDDDEAPAPLPSKARPAPAKPALKKAGSYSDPAASIESLPELAPAPSTPKTSKFGASGMKRGFLNLNPSSPAAEHSSDYVDQAFARATPQTSIAATLAAANEAEKREAEALRRRNQAAQAGATAQSTDDERMSRGSSAGARKKKTVRIRSPSPARARFEDGAGESSSRRPGRLNGADEDVADEAQRIIDLLGPGVVQTDLPGMPGAARAPGPSSVTNPVPPYPPKVRAAPAKAEDTTPARPPMSRDVLERAPPSTSQQKPVNTSASTAKVSAFKRGFLSGPPKPSPSTSTPFVTSLPSKVDPRTSLGMSALDRATKADEPLEKEREAAGLKPAVPHARPSKAYAEKLRQRQEGEDRANGSAQTADAEETTQGSRPEGSSSVRFGAVQVGQAASGDSNSRGTRFKEDIKPEAHEHYEDEEEDDGFSEGHESDDSDKPLAFDTDDESGYDSNDLADLRPKMELDSDELEFDSDADLDADLHLAEIQREYARARASLFGDGTAEALRARRSDDMHEHPGQEVSAWYGRVEWIRLLGPRHSRSSPPARPYGHSRGGRGCDRLYYERQGLLEPLQARSYVARLRCRLAGAPAAGADGEGQDEAVCRSARGGSRPRSDAQRALWRAQSGPRWAVRGGEDRQPAGRGRRGRPACHADPAAHAGPLRTGRSDDHGRRAGDPPEPKRKGTSSGRGGARGRQ